MASAMYLRLRSASKFVVETLKRSIANSRIVEESGKIYAVDRFSRLRIHNARRFVRYSLGVDRRIRKLAGAYGVPKTISIGAGDVVLDIGANIGEFSLYCLKRGADVHAFEPDGAVNEILAENLGGRGTINCFGIWKFSGECSFYVATETADSSLIPVANHTKLVTIPVRTLDDYVESAGIRRIRLIKCDAEGGEPEVFAGAEKALKITDFVAFDCGYERMGSSTYEECAQFLRDRNFEVIDRYYTSRKLVARRKTA